MIEWKYNPQSTFNIIQNELNYTSCKNTIFFYYQKFWWTKNTFYSMYENFTNILYISPFQWNGNYEVAMSHTATSNFLKSTNLGGIFWMSADKSLHSNNKCGIGYDDSKSWHRYIMPLLLVMLMLH